MGSSGSTGEETSRWCGRRRSEGVTTGSFFRVVRLRMLDGRLVGPELDQRDHSDSQLSVEARAGSRGRSCTRRRLNDPLSEPTSYCVVHLTDLRHRLSSRRGKEKLHM
jgi:hypothetical protein